MQPIKLVTFTTIGAARLACNWLESVRLLSLDHRAHVYCGDVAAMRALTKFVEATGSNATVHNVVHSKYLQPGQAIDWGTAGFVDISLAKLALQEAFNDPADFVPYLFCDADTVLLSDPTPQLTLMATQQFDKGIWLQSDRADDEMPTTQSNLVNVGVHFCAAPVPDVFKAAFQWLSERRGSITDHPSGNYVDDQQAVCRALEQTGVAWYILPPKQWRNGQQQWGKTFGAEGYQILIHANWVVGVGPKEKRLRSAGAWFIEESRFEALGLGHELHLLVGHYAEPNKDRAAEYQRCILANVANPFIAGVHVLLEDGSTLVLEGLSPIDGHAKLWFFPLRHRAHYSDFLQYANTTLQGKACILANADVWFDETLGELGRYDLTGKFLCVSRMDCHEPYCQDAWIFQSPVNVHADFELGQPSCDNRIAFAAEAAGLQVLNPCGTIQIHHEHASNVRNYTPQVRSAEGTLLVPPCQLNGEPIPNVQPKPNKFPMGFNPMMPIGRGLMPLQNLTRKF